MSLSPRNGGMSDEQDERGAGNGDPAVDGERGRSGGTVPPGGEDGDAAGGNGAGTTPDTDRETTVDGAGTEGEDGAGYAPGSESASADTGADSPDAEASQGGSLHRYDDLTRAREIVHLSPAERDARDVTDDDVRAAFRTVIEQGDREAKDLQGVTLPALDLDYEVVDGTNKHPVDLRGASVAAISADRASIRLPFDLTGATVGRIELEGAHVTQDFTLDDATVTGSLDTFEVTFDGDLSCRGTTFEAPVELDEGTFTDDASFDDATFTNGFAARNAEFHGDSHLLDDSTSFTGAQFEDGADIRHTQFGYARFEEATFVDNATFEETSFSGDAEFDEVTFEGEADFDESRFGGDASFTDAVFRETAFFRGAVFEGGARVLEADAGFQGTRFEAEAEFKRTVFRVADFTGASFAEAATFTDSRFRDDASFADCTFDGPVGFEESVFREETDAADSTFGGEADFQETTFIGDAAFTDCRFEGLADFDEVLFDGDTDFSTARFADDADFRGAEFRGDANHLAEGVTFADARFDATADFDDTRFSSADFRGTTFGGVVDFAGSEFIERLDCRASVTTASTYVDFTGAKVKRGAIIQPESGWVHFDMTKASLGDVTLDAERESDRRELLDYFRFCNTEFDEVDGLAFDFSDHADYLDRNEWNLHDFTENVGAEHDHALEMTPEVIETTYLKAKNSASSAGDMKAAGEFRVKRQAWSRRKHVDIAKDASVNTTSRLRNASRAAENAFLGLTCGHGMRLLRIAAVFVLAPLLFVPLYTFGGEGFATNVGQLDSLSQLTTPDGMDILLGNVHVSYISYTTIGYGNFNPVNTPGQLMASGEAFLSTVLAALLVYALVKRSEL